MPKLINMRIMVIRPWACLTRGRPCQRGPSGLWKLRCQRVKSAAVSGAIFTSPTVRLDLGEALVVVAPGVLLHGMVRRRVDVAIEPDQSANRPVEPGERRRLLAGEPLMRLVGQHLAADRAGLVGVIVEGTVRCG